MEPERVVGMSASQVFIFGTSAVFLRRCKSPSVGLRVRLMNELSLNWLAVVREEGLGLGRIVSEGPKKRRLS